MGQYTVYCNGSQNLKNLSGGVGELRIDNLGADKADWGWLFFDKSPVPSGEVLDSASVLAVYCHAPYPLSLILGQIAGPSWNGPEWKITSGGVRGAGNLSCQIGITTENQTGAAQFWVDGSDHVPYATIQTHAGKITPSGYYFTYVCIEILAGAARGCGCSLAPMLMTCGGVCVLRVAWIFILLPLRPELSTVLVSYPASWVFTSVLFIFYYLQGGWLRGRIRKMGYAPEERGRKKEAGAH